MLTMVLVEDITDPVVAKLTAVEPAGILSGWLSIVVSIFAFEFEYFLL
jgi:hypothetical protein